MYKLVVKSNALLMAKDAYEWYEEQRPGLGEEFLSELDLCFSKIQANPAFYGFVENTFRRIALKRFPYIVIYEIIENELIVYAVFHTSRNPDKRFGS